MCCCGSEFVEKMPEAILEAIRKARGDLEGSLTDQDYRKRLQEKFGTKSSVSAEELVSLDMSNSSNSAEDIPISNLEQMMMYMLSFSEPGTPEVLYFSRADITEFLY